MPRGDGGYTSTTRFEHYVFPRWAELTLKQSNVSSQTTLESVGIRCGTVDFLPGRHFAFYLKLGTSRIHPSGTPGDVSQRRWCHQVASERRHMDIIKHFHTDRTWRSGSKHRRLRPHCRMAEARGLMFGGFIAVTPEGRLRQRQGGRVTPTGRSGVRQNQRSHSAVEVLAATCYRNVKPGSG